jgi:ATP-binding cassette subfamily B protein
MDAHSLHIEPNRCTAARRPRRALLRRALSFVRPERRAVVTILALTLSVGGLTAVDPLLYKRLFDALAGRVGVSAVAAQVALLSALGIARELLAAASSFLTWRTRLRVHYSLLGATVERLHLLPIDFHREAGVGATMTRLDRGIQGFLTAVTELLFQALPAAVYLAVSLVIMVRLDWRLAAVVLLFAPLPAAITAMTAGRVMRRERRLLDAWARIYSRFNEVLSGIVTVKSFAMEDAEKRRFLDDVDAANREVIRGVGFDSGVSATQNAVVALARAAALAVGALLVARGAIGVGTLIAFLGYVGGLFGPVQGLAGVFRTLRAASAALETIFAILDAEEHLGDAPDARELASVRGEVRFERVRFAYRPGGPTVTLDGIDLTVRPGELVAIIGPSGSGKTTMMALLQRFYDPQEGAVRIDGHDLRTLKQRSIRRHIGVVLQDALLFNESVRANIAYGRPDASMAEVEAAARAANAHEFIVRLPNGYETPVGERGGRLSAGERQRIAIARALLKDPRILVFDEATAALDAETEALVQEAIERLIAGRTTFLIAHRLSTVVHADRIVVLDGGRVVDVGTHAELIGRGGLYARLVERQTAGLLPARAA